MFHLTADRLIAQFSLHFEINSAHKKQTKLLNVKRKRAFENFLYPSNWLGYAWLLLKENIPSRRKLRNMNVSLEKFRAVQNLFERINNLADAVLDGVLANCGEFIT